MTREEFVRRLKLVQDFHFEQNILSDLINKLSDGFAVATIGSLLANEVLNQLNKDMEMDDIDFLEWWLYEDVEKNVYIDGVAIDVKTPEKLYDFIKSN